MMSLVIAPLCASDTRKPNVIVIMADDLGYGDISCNGSKNISTPNIDKLAKEGRRFTSGYSSASTCTPTRYSLMTGTYAFRTPGTGIAAPNAGAIIQPGTETIATIMKKAGYATAVVGKWHLGLGEKQPNWNGELKPGPLEIGFDHCLLLPTTNDRVPQVFVQGHRVRNLDPKEPLWVGDKKPSDDHPTGITERAKLKLDWSRGHNDTVHNGIGRIGFYTGGAKARFKDEDLADEWVRECDRWITSQKDSPFFLFFASHSVHVPRIPHERFQGKSGLGLRGDAILEFDWQVGEVMKTLDRLNLTENTLVMLCSDNGPVLDDGYQDGAVEKLGTHKPAGPFRGGKYGVFEGGTRIPFIARWPGRIKLSVSDEVVCTIDLAASLATLTGVQLEKTTCPDSFDVLGALLGDLGAKGRDHLLQQDNSSSNFGLRVGKWKLVRQRTTAKDKAGPAYRESLFDLESDPGETKNVADQHPDETKRLHDILEKELTERKSRPDVASSVPKRPLNVLFIAVDDLRPEFGCYGAKHIHSPNLDRLAARGVLFNRAYCQQAVCSPSRSSLVTGTRPDTTKVWDLQTHFRTALPNVVTLPQHFKQNGYFVQGMGKMYHGSLDDPPSWSTPLTSAKAKGMYGRPENNTIVEAKKEAMRKATPSVRAKMRSYGPAFESSDVPDNSFHDGALADQAVKALQKFATKDQPFWLGVGFIRPHLPFVAPKKYWDLYDPSKIELATNPFLPKGAPDYAIMPGGELRSYHGMPGGEIPKDTARQLKHGYYAAISYMDAQLGRVLDELDRLKLDWCVGEVMAAIDKHKVADNTLIIFTSDNGGVGDRSGHKCNGVLRGFKGAAYEGGTRVPFIVRWPGQVPAGKTSGSVVSSVDLLATCEAITRIPLPKDAGPDSFDILPALQAVKPSKPCRDTLIMQPLVNNLAIRKANWKLIPAFTPVKGESQPAELYDLEADLSEANNLAEKHPDKVRELTALLDEQRKAGRSRPEKE
jgi:arylsulfatase A